jgi:DNA-binding transcriptional LysR family regulator
METNRVMDTIETLRTFVRVIETGSLSAVAREMNASQSTVSRQITQLEEHFGVRLFHRTTRHLSLTDDGENLREHAVNVLGMVDGMETTLGQHKSSPIGHVRVATPVSLGLILMNRVPDLMARYPGLSVELVMEDDPGDMIEERLDLAVHSGEVVNQSLIKRSLGAVVRVAVAAPDYLARHGTPSQPGELTDHACIVHRVTPSDSEWRLLGPEGPVEVTVHGALSTNNNEAVRGAAVSGLGIALLPEYQVVEDVLAGRLRRVLPDHTSGPLPAYLVYPSRRHLPPRTRVVMDFLIDDVRRLRSRRAIVDTPSLVLLPRDGAKDGERAQFTVGDDQASAVQAKGRCEHRPHASPQDLVA